MGGKPKDIIDIIQLNSREAISPTADKVIFVVRPELEVIRSVIFQKQCFKTEKEIYILYVPRRTIECDEELEKAGLYEEDRIKQISMDLIPLDDDLLSLELNDNFAHYMLLDDDNYKVYVKDSIARIESVFGQIKYKFAKGSDSCQILRRIKESAPVAD